MKLIRLALAVLLVPAFAAMAQVNGTYPPGTLLFNGETREVVAAPGGGVYAATSTGVVHYSESGERVIATMPGATAPWDIAVAPDGSIWIATSTSIIGLSDSGTILEQYAVAGVRDLAVAQDGAPWYTRGSLGNTLGRIANGVATEFPSPTQAWHFAPAGGADMWLLGNGFGTSLDSVYRVGPTGVSTATPLGYNVLFGYLQVLPDGTLYITTGLNGELLRLAPGGGPVTLVTSNYGAYLVEPGRDFWVGGYEFLGRITESTEQPDVLRRMPEIPWLCETWPFHVYEPAAIDADGYLWVRVIEEYGGIVGFPSPCPYPTPPPLPGLIRIDIAQFIAEPAHAADVPTLSEIMLIALAAAIAFAAVRLLHTV